MNSQHQVIFIDECSSAVGNVGVSGNVIRTATDMQINTDWLEPNAAAANKYLYYDFGASVADQPSYPLTAEIEYRLGEYTAGTTFVFDFIDIVATTTGTNGFSVGYTSSTTIATRRVVAGVYSQLNVISPVDATTWPTSDSGSPPWSTARLTIGRDFMSFQNQGKATSLYSTFSGMPVDKPRYFQVRMFDAGAGARLGIKRIKVYREIPSNAWNYFGY